MLSITKKQRPKRPNHPASACANTLASNVVPLSHADGLLKEMRRPRMRKWLNPHKAGQPRLPALPVSPVPATAVAWGRTCLGLCLLLPAKFLDFSCCDFSFLLFQ